MRLSWASTSDSRSPTATDSLHPLRRRLRRQITRSFTARRLYTYQPQDIWDVITSGAFLLAGWAHALRGPMIPQAGFSLPIRTAPIPGTAFSGYFDCQFIEVRHCARLAYGLTSVSTKPHTFRGSVDLRRRGQGTRLTFTLSGFASEPLAHAPVHEMLEDALEQLAAALAIVDNTRRAKHHGPAGTHITAGLEAALTGLPAAKSLDVGRPIAHE